MQNPQPLDRSQVRDLGIIYHTALKSLREGKGSLQDIEAMGTAANVALVLCEAGLGADWIEKVKAGQDAIVRTAERGLRLRRFVFTGPDLQAVTAMLELHDSQLESPDCTDSLVMQAIGEVERRRADGQVLKVA